MKRDYRSLFGLLLILGGVLLILQQYDYLQGEWSDAVFAGLWALGALFFYDMFSRDRAQWWFGMVSLILAGIAANHVLDLFFPAFGAAIGGALFLAAIGIGFLIAYRRNAANWWAIIPAGVMFTLATISVVDDLGTELPFETGGLLFVGIGLTFLFLTQLRVDGERLSWAIFPAIPLLILGIFVGLGQDASWGYIWPALLIVLGAYFLIDALRRR
ncbi:MAG: hypothetical protein WEC16_01810 [Anaerolineales bacterium]